MYNITLLFYNIIMINIPDESAEELPQVVNLLRYAGFAEKQHALRTFVLEGAIKKEENEPTEQGKAEKLRGWLTIIQAYGNTADILTDIRKDHGTIMDCRGFLLRMKERILGQFGKNAREIFRLFIQDAGDFVGQCLVENSSVFREFGKKAESNAETPRLLLEMIGTEQTRVREVLTELLLSPDPPTGSSDTTPPSGEDLPQN